MIATKERVPDNATEDQFRKNLGNPELTLYDSGIIGASLLVFLNKGVAIRTSENRVFVLVRFSPQTKKVFLANIAPVVGMSTEKPKEGPEPNP